MRNVLQDVFSDGMNKVSIDLNTQGEALTTRHTVSAQASSIGASSHHAVMAWY